MYNDLEYAPSEKYMEICENYYDTRMCYNIVSKYMQINIKKNIKRGLKNGKISNNNIHRKLY